MNVAYNCPQREQECFTFALLDICNHQHCEQMLPGWVDVVTVRKGTIVPCL